MTKKFRLLKRRIGCENSLFTTFLDDIQSPDGEIIRNFFITAPKGKNKNMLTGVAVLPVFKGKIALLHIYRHALGGFGWEVPRGFIDKGETTKKSASRELTEETGLTCNAKDLVFLGFSTPDGGVLAARIAIFAALHCRQAKNFKMEEFGHRELKFVTTKKMEQMIASGKVDDSATLLAYYKYSRIPAG
ncbi:MAG: NUDIX hydrolase [Deltaproteobacteria bacterium]|nr:NUDIX hydrolase [Deltaproteobacteria bacterium]